MKEFLQETKAQIVRWLIHLSREPFFMAFSLVQPLIWMIFFSSLFQKMVSSQFDSTDYRTFMTPAVIVMTIFGNTMMAGIPLLFDKELGFINKLLSAPIHRSSIIVSEFIYVSAVTIVQTLLILAVAMIMGVSMATGFLGIGFLVMVGMALGFGITVISLALAFVLKQHGDFFAITGFLTLPLIFISSAFVPIDFMPHWMAFLARLNPMTFAVDGIRALIIDGWAWNLLLRVIPLLLIFDLICIFIGGRVFQRNLH